MDVDLSPQSESFKRFFTIYSYVMASIGRKYEPILTDEELFYIYDAGWADRGSPMLRDLTLDDYDALCRAIDNVFRLRDLIDDDPEVEKGAWILFDPRFIVSTYSVWWYRVRAYLTSDHRENTNIAEHFGGS